MLALKKSNGTTVSLTKLGEDKYRLSVQKASAQGAWEELTKSETEALISGLIKAYEAAPEDDSASKRHQAVTQALREYAASRQTTVETIDKEISSSQVLVDGKKRAMTREEWLADKLGSSDLEEVLAGKMSLAEALADGGEEVELEAAGLDESSPDSGDSLRA